jgi:ABC-2 type transport system permease protein
MSVPHTVRAAPTLLRIGFAEIVAYRAEMAIWVLTATMPLIMLALWNAVARDGPVAGFGQVEFARYFAAALVVRQLTGAWIL